MGLLQSTHCVYQKVSSTSGVPGPPIRANGKTQVQLSANSSETVLDLPDGNERAFDSAL
jgi:hypothetical protein